MTLETPDVLVVGLGPAGSRAAEAAARAGCSVIALEKRGEPGSPVQCAEFVPSMIERDVPAVGTVTDADRSSACSPSSRTTSTRSKRPSSAAA